MPTTSAEPRAATARPRRYPAAQPNYFNDAGVAARYARVRPFYHAEVAERVRSLAGVARFRSVLDVGCGSGHSSLALAAVADAVTAIDPSPSMLAAAQPAANILYRLGAAEELDFASGEFDVVSAASSLHWFEQPRFYGECRKVLAEDGWLVIYNDHFTAHMQASLPGQQAKDAPAGDPAPPQPAKDRLAGDPAACKRWMRTRFAKRYPAPRRGMRDMNEARAAECGFRVAHRGSFSHVVRYSRQEFIAYLLTRSNTLAAVAHGRDSEATMREWLDCELTPIVGEGGEFIFKCNFWMLRRT